LTDITPAKTSLYELLKEAGCQMDSWQSDLYVRATVEAREIIKEYESEGHITNKQFIRQKDGFLWIELPFHYVPWWTARLGADQEQEQEIGAAPAM